MIRFRALGECAFDIGAERLGPEAELAFALLMVLVMADGRRLSRRQVVELLWPATSEERARHNLRQTLYKLRQLGVPVDSEAGQLRLPPQVVDASLVLPGPADDPPSGALLRPDLPFGEFLAGYAPRFSAPFAAWVEEQRGVVHARLRRALLALMSDERRRGNWGLVETLARKCLLVDSLNEEATMALAEATALSGSKQAAIQLLDGYLREIGPDAGDLRLPAAMLRRRIAERLPAQASFSAAPDCFVGREESIAFLREQLRPVIAGRARAVLVHGEEGMGKSRLVAEFVKMAALDGVNVARVASQSRDVDRPLSAFVDVVPVLQGLPGALGCSPESVEYLRRLTDHDPEVLEPSEATREAELLFASVRRAIFDLIDAVADEAPLILCVEDTHWLDDRSWRVMRELAGRLAESPVLLLFTSRLPHATPRPPTQGTPWLELHRLPPLEQPAALTLFTTVVGPSAPPAAFRDWAVHVASGNPFFVRALASHWVETGELRAPASLQALVAARVERLTGRPLRTLQACAVLGKQATLGRVEAVLEYPRHALIEATAALEDAGFLATDGAAIPCRHDLIARAALTRLPDGVKRLLHRSAGEVLERDVRDARSAALLWDCAQQWKLAGESARALALVRSTATHMLEVGLPSEAAEAYERAIELCETDSERLEMLRDLATANQLAGRWPKLISTLEELLALQEHTHAFRQRYPREAITLLEARWRTDEDLPSLLIKAENQLCDRNAPPSYRIDAAIVALIFADNLCWQDAAERVYSRASQILTQDDAHARERLRIDTMYHSSYGDIDCAAEAALEWIRYEKRHGTPLGLARALRNAAIPLRLAGDIDRAYSVLVESYDISSRYGLTSAAAGGAGLLAMLNLSQADTNGARHWYDTACQWLGMLDEPSTGMSINRLGVRVALAEGRPSDARRVLQLKRETLSKDSVSRRRVAGYALFTAVALQTDPSLVDAQLITEYEREYSAVAPYGDQDFATEVLTSALYHLGQRQRAVRLLKTYSAEVRRERSALPPSLREMLRSCD